METSSLESKERNSLHLLYCIHQFIYQLNQGEGKKSEGQRLWGEAILFFCYNRLFFVSRESLCHVAVQILLQFLSTFLLDLGKSYAGWRWQ